MVVEVEELISMDEFKGMDREGLASKLKAVEALIRSYTNNNFQNRNMRVKAPSVGGAILTHCPYFKAGDTVQVSQSGLNDGVYEVVEATGSRLKLDRELYDSPSNTVTKVIYPEDIRKGVVDLMAWEKANRKKVGIKSEELSRHSVTYFDQDTNNQVMGYPVALLGFLKPYVKPRF